MQTEAGVVKLKVVYGQNVSDEHWGCPIREHWGPTSHPQLSLALKEKLAFTITATASYEAAASLAQKGGPVTDSLVHSLTRRLHWEALRAGRGRAGARSVVADGAPWIWNLVSDRWPGATELLYFYHASQHLWDMGRALPGADEAATTR